MSFPTYYENEQSAERALAITARYYLLDRDFLLISARTGAENAEIGTSFFNLYPANRVLREEIEAYVTSYPDDVFLTLCARTPVLFVGTLFAKTGLILAFLPEGKIKKTLSLPAAFHRAPEHVSVSTFAKMYYKAYGEAEFSAASRWLLDTSAPFLYPSNADQPLSAVLAMRIKRLATLLDTTLSCDLSGLPAMGTSGVDLEFVTGVILATLMAAQRVGCTDVQIYAAMEGTPTLYLQYFRADASDALTEFHSLLNVAAARGAILDVVSPKEDPLCVQVRVGIGVVELSAQGVRERHRFLEGKSPLSFLSDARAISLPFPELSFD